MEKGGGLMQGNYYFLTFGSLHIGSLGFSIFVYFEFNLVRLYKLHIFFLIAESVLTKKDDIHSLGT